MTGGLRPKIKGDQFEHAVVLDQERIGRWCRRLRQGGGEVVDLVSVETHWGPRHLALGLHTVFLIQCKLAGYLRPVERERLVLEARSIGAVPLLAWKVDGAIQYREVT